MNYTISMDKAGRIVIPKEVRERIGADENTQFELEVLLDHIELTPKEPLHPPPQVLKEAGMWVVTSPGESFDALESIKATREEHERSVAPDTLDVT